jgi:hypothetical protein
VVAGTDLLANRLFQLPPRARASLLLPLYRHTAIRDALIGCNPVVPSGGEPR